jgi:hypothetical protein
MRRIQPIASTTTPTDEPIPFADKLRQQQNSDSSYYPRRQAVSDEVHSLMSGGTRSKRQRGPVVTATIHRQQQQQRGKNRMRAVLAAFGDCTVRKDANTTTDNKRRISCGVPPRDLDEDDEHSTHENHRGNTCNNISRWIIIALIVYTVFGVGKKNGREQAAVGIRAQQQEDDTTSSSSSWFDTTSSNISLLSTLEKSLERFSQLEEEEDFEKKPDNTTASLQDENTMPKHTYHHASFPDQMNHLSNLTMPFDGKVETPYFWDVHFSVSTYKHIVHYCMSYTERMQNYK